MVGKVLGVNSGTVGAAVPAVAEGMGLGPAEVGATEVGAAGLGWLLGAPAGLGPENSEQPDSNTGSSSATPTDAIAPRNDQTRRPPPGQ